MSLQPLFYMLYVELQDALMNLLQLWFGENSKLCMAHNNESGIFSSFIVFLTCPFLSPFITGVSFVVLSHCLDKEVSVFSPFLLEFLFPLLRQPSSSDPHWFFPPLSCPLCAWLPTLNFSCCIFLCYQFILLPHRPLFVQSDWILWHPTTTIALFSISPHFADCSNIFPSISSSRLFSFKQTATLFSTGTRELEQAAGLVG